MKSQDRLRLWIKEQLDARGRGARADLAVFLGLTPLKITYMLNTETGKQTRSIQADEWLKILLFLGMEETNPAVPRAALKKGKPIIALPPHSAAHSAKQIEFMKILDNVAPKRQAAFIKIIRALAESYNIPH